MKHLALAALVLVSGAALAQNIVQQAPTTFSGTDFQRTSGVIGLKPRPPAFSPMDFGADPTGVADSTAAIQAAQAACVAAGGGEIDISAGRFLHLGNLTVAQGCPIVGQHTPHSRTTTGNDFWALKSSLVHGSGATVNVGRGAALRGVLVLSSSVNAAPADYQAGVALVANMAGTGITITGSGTLLEDVQHVGFATGVSSVSWSGGVMRNVKGDARDYCIFVNGANDQVALANVHCWPYMTASQSWTTATTAVTGAGDNGVGKIRLTVASTANFASGNRLFVASVGGYAGANQTCDNATVVDATHIDCPNSQSAPTATAAVTAGSNVVVLTAANKSIQAGQTVADTTTAGNIPGGATVLFVADGGRLVYLSAAATGTGAADAVAFTNPAYTSGGTVTLPNDYRTGTAFYIQNTDLFVCHACTEYGYKIGLDIFDGMGGNYSDVGIDDISSIGDNDGIGIRFGGDSHNNHVTASYTDARQGIISNSTNDSANIVRTSLVGVQTVATVLALDGRLQMTGSSERFSVTNTYRFLVLNTASLAQFCGDFPSTQLYYQGAAAQSATKTCATPGGLEGDIQLKSGGALAGLTPASGMVSFLTTSSSLALSGTGAGTLSLGGTQPLVGGIIGVAAITGSTGTTSLSRYAASASGPQFNFGKSRGTVLSAAAVASADVLGAIGFVGDDGLTAGSIGSTAALQRVRVDGAPVGAIVPGRFEFLTANSAGTLAGRLYIWSSGGVSIATNPVADPGTQNLTVAGDITVTGAINAQVPVAIGWVAGVDPNNTTIMTASRAVTVTDIRGRVASPTGAAATATVYKAPSGTACGSGTAQHTGTYDANGTANTNQSLTLAGGAANTLAAGDSLCLVTTGTWTGAGNGAITVTMR